MNFLDYYSIPDFLNFLTPFAKIVVYSLIFSIIGIIQAYLIKTKGLVKKPTNIVNMVVMFVVALTITRCKGIPQEAMHYVIISYFVTEMICHKLFPIKIINVMEIEAERTNINLEEYVAYHKEGVLCVALQDNSSTLKRIFLGRHVFVEANSNTSWSLGYTEPLFICNNVEVVEKRLEFGEESEERILGKLHGIFKPKTQVVLRLDVVEAHEVNRFEFIRDVKILDKVVENYEKLGIKYAKLRTLLTALLVRKHRKVLIGAIKTFEDAITITEEDRGIIKEVIGEEEKKAEKKEKKVRESVKAEQTAE